MELVANFILNNESLDANFDVSEVQNFDALFEIYASGTVWGTIEGDITNQTDLQNILNGISGNIGEIETTVSDLQTTVSDNYSELNTKIQNEAATRTESDNLLQGNINTLSDNLTAEISNRESADSGLQTQITNLTGTVSSNYNTLNNSISNLSDIVDDLSDTVDSNYNVLDTKIDTTQTTLQGNINTLSGTVTSNYNDLTQSITNNVSTLNTRITNEVSTLNGAISNEATARANADNNLQTQIDAIVSSSDVFDIVGTYAELQAYDISTVPVNDIIKVLVDSTHNNAATYYRCVENNGVKSWSYIGSEGAYYTKGEADSTFVPQTRTINNKALNQNINLTASDVGALPVGTQIGNGTILLTQGGVQKGTFTLNQTGNATIDFDAVSEDITVDSELSTTSTNPVQNKVITGALNDKQDVLTAGTDLEIVKVLPSGYTQLKSITSTGSQYINTGLWSSDNFKAEIVGRFTSTTGTQCMLGASVRTSSATYKDIMLGKNASQYYVGNGSPWYQPNQTNSSATLDTNEHTFVVEVTSSTTKISVDGVENSANYVFSSIEENLYLFANNAVVSGSASSAADFAQFELESIKLYSSNNLIFNGVPCKRGDIAGLYDVVSETFMPSLGSSAFVAGDEVVTQTIINFTNDSGYTKNKGTVTSVNGVQPDTNGNVTIETGGVTDVEVNGNSVVTDGVAEIDLTGYQEKLTAGTDLEIIEGTTVNLPEGYTQLEYIQFTGTQYINTGILGNAGLETDVTFSFDEVPRDNSVLASRVGNTRIYPIHIYQGWCIGYGSYYNTFNTPLVDIVYNVVTVLKAGQQTMTVNNYQVVNRTDDTVYNTDIPLYLGAQANASSAGGTITAQQFVKIKLYRIKIKSNGVLVFDGVPCKRGDIVGLYNTVTNEFLLNSGTGALIAGAEVPSSTVINFTNETGYTTNKGTVTSVNNIQPDASGNVTISIPSAVTESTVAGWGFTKNIGTVTSVNGVSPTNGNVAITIPTVNNGTLTITQDGNTLGTFGANQSGNSTINTKGLYDYYTPNVVTIGSPIITENVMSGFSTSNYARMGSIINSNNQPWEYFIKFTVNTIPSAAAYIIGDNSGITNGIYLYLTNNNKLGVTIGSSGTSFGTISANTTYKARIIVGADDNYNESLNVTNVYLYNENDILLSSKQKSATWYNDIQSVFGVSNLTSPSNPFDGSIDFGETYINFLSNGTATRVWNGTEPTIDTKANTDLTNITDSAKVMMSGMGMPSNKYVNLTLGASGTTYTAPSNGWYNLSKNASANGQWCDLRNVTNGFYISSPYLSSASVFRSAIPVKKNDVLQISYNLGGATNFFRFYYAVGSESEV